MPHDAVPQPSLERMTPFAGHPIVAGVVPDQHPLVVRTAAALAQAVGAPTLYLAFADVRRYAVAERPDGTVRHAAIAVDAAQDDWQDLDAALRDELTAQLRDTGVNWEFRYLAGRPDRALTHLARAVDAAALVVGTRAPRPGARLRELVEGSVAAHLSHHQHRPVVTVPLDVVDWKELRGPWDR